MKKHLIKIIILVIIFGGFFSLARSANAVGEKCWNLAGQLVDPFIASETNCKSIQSTNVWSVTAPAPNPLIIPPSGTAFTPPATQTATAAPLSGLDLGCTLFNGMTGITGCVAGIFNIFWTVSAIIARLAGQFLDFFIYYSTNSASYTNQFVEKGWGTVRDVANIFFIVALLYIAIKIVLSLDSSGSKKLIANVVVIALIINFSLFTTRVIIDASNILAKTFYNKITPVTTNGSPLTNAGGEKSISVGLVNKFNPQTLVAQPFYDANQGTYIFMTILLTVITLYTAYMFFAVALLFVGRVVSLWMSMIFAPLAFISYTVPFDIPGFGHKEWWDDLLKNAFLAPLFIFFLYIIVLFTGFLNNIISYTDNLNLTSTANLMQHLMSVVIPFAILMMLLIKAKKLAVKYSGSMGQAVMSVGKMVGGVALGAATGGAAMVGTATLGRAGAALANSTWAKRREGRGDVLSTVSRDLFKAMGSGSFDVRGIKIAGQTLGGATGMKVGEAQKGGFEQRRKDQIEKRQKRAKELEVGEDETLTQNLHTLENDLQELRAVGSHEIGEIDKRIEAAIKADKAAQSALNAARGTAGEQNARKLALTTSNRVADLRQQRSDIKNANGDQANIQSLTANINNRQAHLQLAQQAGNVNDITQAEAALHSAQVALNVAQRAHDIGQTNGLGDRSMNNFEDTLIPEAHHAIEHESRQRKRDYSESMRTPWEQAKQWLLTGGQYSPRGAREAAHKIRMEAKIEEKGVVGGH